MQSALISRLKALKFDMSIRSPWRKKKFAKQESYDPHKNPFEDCYDAVDEETGKSLLENDHMPGDMDSLHSNNHSLAEEFQDSDDDQFILCREYQPQTNLYVPKSMELDNQLLLTSNDK